MANRVLAGRARLDRNEDVLQRMQDKHNPQTVTVVKAVYFDRWRFLAGWGETFRLRRADPRAIAPDCTNACRTTFLTSGFPTGS